jgi:hypothetical protein
MVEFVAVTFNRGMEWLVMESWNEVSERIEWIEGCDLLKKRLLCEMGAIMFGFGSDAVCWNDCSISRAERRMGSGKCWLVPPPF